MSPVLLNSTNFSARSMTSSSDFYKISFKIIYNFQFLNQKSFYKVFLVFEVIFKCATKNNMAINLPLMS